MLRLFFAVWPSPSWCAQLRALAAGALANAGGRPQESADCHVTLCFLGAVDEAQRVPLCRSCERIATVAAAFTLSFDRLEYWHRPRVLAAVASQTPAAATALVEQLVAAAATHGLKADPKPWRPHLTLARSVPARQFREPARSVQTLSDAKPLAVEHFHLVESRRTDHRRYQLLASWPLIPNTNA
jgi:2'-5' RNA ligase